MIGLLFIAAGIAAVIYDFGGTKVGGLFGVGAVVAVMGLRDLRRDRSPS